MLQSAKNLFRASGAEAPAAAGARAGSEDELAEGSNPFPGEASSSAAPGGSSVSADLIQRASSLCRPPSLSGASGFVMKRTSSLGASSASFDPSDPFPRLSASELGGKKKSTIMWQRAMRKSAREVPASLPGEGAGVGLEGAGVGLEGAGVGLSSGGGWLVGVCGWGY